MTEEKGGLARYGLKAIFNRNFNVVAVVNLLIMTAYYMIFVTGTLYVRDAYGVSLSVAGFSSGIMVIGCLAGRFIAGSLLSLPVRFRFSFCSVFSRALPWVWRARPRVPSWPMWCPVSTTDSASASSP